MGSTDMSRELMQQALEALEIGHEAAQEEAENYHATMRGFKPARHAAMDADVRKIADAIAAVKAALLTEVSEAQMVHAAALAEPVGVVDEVKATGEFHVEFTRPLPIGTRLYTEVVCSTGLCRYRKPLSDDEIVLIMAECAASAHRSDDISFARAIEEAHGIKQEEA